MSMCINLNLTYQATASFSVNADFFAANSPWFSGGRQEVVQFRDGLMSELRDTYPFFRYDFRYLDFGRGRHALSQDAELEVFSGPLEIAARMEMATERLKSTIDFRAYSESAAGSLAELHRQSIKFTGPLAAALGTGGRLVLRCAKIGDLELRYYA